MKNLLSLDQSLNTTGFAYFENGKIKDCGLFKINNKMPMPQRLGTFYKELSKMSARYDFDTIAFEGIQNQNNNSTFQKLAYVQAAVMLWVYFNDVNIKEYLPSHWRKILSDKYHFRFGRKRAEQKRNAQKLVDDKMHIQVEEDVADAICIGWAAIADQEPEESAF